MIYYLSVVNRNRAVSSVGRAPGLHPGCREFESLTAHFPGCSAAGSALGLGPRCRRFESCHPDKRLSVKDSLFFMAVFFSFPNLEPAYIKNCYKKVENLTVLH